MDDTDPQQSCNDDDIENLTVILKVDLFTAAYSLSPLYYIGWDS